MQENALEAGTTPRTPLGSLQRSPDSHLVERVLAEPPQEPHPSSRPFRHPASAIRASLVPARPHLSNHLN